MREIVGVNQDVYQQRKRWFTCNEMDLFVWHDDSRKIISFQLCYDKLQNEKALMWTREAKFSHFYVDEGAQPGNHPASPLFAEHSHFDNRAIVDSFVQHSKQIEQQVVEFVTSTILDAK